MSSQPAFYKDSLAARAAPTRYRNIGNPYAFLSTVGIDPILEEIYKGRNIVNVAQTLNVGIGVLLNWLEHEGHMQKIEDATKFSAEGYLGEATTLLREAKTDFELKKAKELAKHGQFMASKLDKSKYGQDSKALPNAAGVTFIMHMGDKTLNLHAAPVNEARVLPPEVTSIDGHFSIIPSPSLFLATDDPDVAQPDSIGPFEDEPFRLGDVSVPDYLEDLT